MSMILYLVVFALTAFIAYRKILFRCKYMYWKKRKVPHPPVSPFFGNISESLFLRKSLGQIYDGMYKSYPSLSYVGMYKLRKQGILVRDPELVKEVLIKSFSSFHDNDVELDEKADPLLLNNPFFSTGESWKNVKHQISPLFTGKRIKSMFTLLEEACKKLIKYVEETDPGKYGFEAKDLASKYSADVAANCAFGVDANSFENSSSEFIEMTEKLVSPSLFTYTKIVINSIFPPLANVLKVKYIPDDVAKYFRTIVSQTLEYRKNNNIQRDDFLGLMNEFKSKLGENMFTNDDIITHGLAILFDGYALGSIVLSFALYELGANLDIQKKVKKEIDDIIEQHGKLSYDAIQEMLYLDKVLNESLRKNTAMPYYTKLCTEEFKFPAPDGNGPDVEIEPGTSIVIPVSSLHNDPKYYPDPDKFDPERFSEENKETRPKCTFLPFGDGPRICLGQRFGAAQIKVALVTLVLNFEIKVNKKTISPIEIEPKGHFLAAKDGLWLDFRKRQGKDTKN